jgi:hypothetical protein
MGDEYHAYREGSHEQQARQDYSQLYFDAYFHSYTEPEKKWNNVNQHMARWYAARVFPEWP